MRGKFSANRRSGEKYDFQRGGGGVTWFPKRYICKYRTLRWVRNSGLMSLTAPWKSLWVTAVPGLGIRKPDITLKQPRRFLLINIYIVERWKLLSLFRYSFIEGLVLNMEVPSVSLIRIVIKDYLRKNDGVCQFLMSFCYV